jgi:hypothetical protein
VQCEVAATAQAEELAGRTGELVELLQLQFTAAAPSGGEDFRAGGGSPRLTAPAMADQWFPHDALVQSNFRMAQDFLVDIWRSSRCPPWSCSSARCPRPPPFLP